MYVSTPKGPITAPVTMVTTSPLMGTVVSTTFGTLGNTENKF